MTTTCPSCGARVDEEQSKCDLCGTSLEASRQTPTGESDDADRLPEREGTACSVCGSTNPAGSRFCNQCGSKLPEVRSAGALADLPRGRRSKREAGREDRERVSEPSAPDADRGMVKRVLFTVGAGVLLMMMLYGVTLLSEGQPASSGTTSEAAKSASPDTGPSTPSASQSGQSASPAPPLPGNLAAEADSLKASIGAASDSSTRIDLQQKLVQLYVRAGRQDLAGDVQVRIAEAEQTAGAWADAGNLYYDWMMDRESRAGQTQYAKKTISAYQKSLKIDPTNLDVRTDMAVAYLYDPDNPMQAIKQTRKVLEQDPDHVQANFNRGIMLLRINRVEEAIKQFERVKSLAASDSPVYQRTEQVLQQIRKNR